MKYYPVARPTQQCFFPSSHIFRADLCMWHFDLLILSIGWLIHRWLQVKQLGCGKEDNRGGTRITVIREENNEQTSQSSEQAGSRLETRSTRLTSLYYYNYGQSQGMRDRKRGKWPFFQDYKIWILVEKCIKKKCHSNQTEGLSLIYRTR